LRVGTLGDNFPAIIVADPKKLRDILPRCKQATHTKILEACIALTEEADLAAALRDCSGSEKIIATILETRADGLRRYTPYDLIGDDGLTFGQADKLAQSAYGQQFRPFDPAGLARAPAAAECMIAERAKLRGDTGAPVEKVHHDLALQYAVPTDTFQKAAAHLAERRGFVLKPDDPSHIWIGRYHHAERNIAAIVTTLLDKGTSVIKRRPSRNVTLFPGTEAERVATLNDSQHAAQKGILENRFFLLDGAGGPARTRRLPWLRRQSVAASCFAPSPHAQARLRVKSPVAKQ
jgi:hypothetical protein